MIKYFAIFSEKFACIYYGDEIYDSPKKIVGKKGEFRVFDNPNLSFEGSMTLQKGLLDAFNAFPSEMTEFRRLAALFPWLEFDPRSADQVRMLGLTLSLPILGGYGRGDKYTFAPKSAKDLQIGKDIGKAFESRIALIHARAIANKINPIRNEDEWIRASLSYMKSTSAAEKN